jgi:hypothetical protein
MTVWEKIPDEGIADMSMFIESHRLKVYGGWIVRTVIVKSVAQTFVLDPDHHWKLEQ